VLLTLLLAIGVLVLLIVVLALLGVIGLELHWIVQTWSGPTDNDRSQ
jgi:hypothetical protein